MKHDHWRLFLFGAVAAWATVSTSAAFADDDWQAGAPPEWAKILADAKKEGHVAVVGPSELAVPMAEAFLKDTGIQVDFLGGVAAVNQSRVAREVRSGNVTVDFMFTGTAELPLVKEGFFEDEKAKLLLPGTADPKNWQDGKLTWVDNTQKYMLRTQATVQSIPFFNSDTVKPPLTSSSRFSVGMPSSAAEPVQTAWFARDVWRLAEDAGDPAGVRELFARRYRAACEALQFAGDLDEAWTSYLGGYYGACLRDVTPETIAAKERLVARLTAQLATPHSDDPVWCARLRADVEALDGLEKPFAGCDRARFGATTRDRLITAARAMYPHAFGATIASVPLERTA